MLPITTILNKKPQSRKKTMQDRKKRQGIRSDKKNKTLDLVQVRLYGTQSQQEISLTLLTFLKMNFNKKLKWLHRLIKRIARFREKLWMLIRIKPINNSKMPQGNNWITQFWRILKSSSRKKKISNKRHNKSKRKRINSKTSPLNYIKNRKTRHLKNFLRISLMKKSFSWSRKRKSAREITSLILKR